LNSLRNPQPIFWGRDAAHSEVNAMTPIAVNIPQAAAMIGIARSSLYRLFQDGQLTPRKSGKRTLVLVSDIERYVANLPKAYELSD
jgi:predicted DNA-binding transcriptional regulator AlpA